MITQNYCPNQVLAADVSYCYLPDQRRQAQEPFQHQIPCIKSSHSTTSNREFIAPVWTWRNCFILVIQCTSCKKKQCSICRQVSLRTGLTITHSNIQNFKCCNRKIWKLSQPQTNAVFELLKDDQTCTSQIAEVKNLNDICRHYLFCYIYTPFKICIRS